MKKAVATVAKVINVLKNRGNKSSIKVESLPAMVLHKGTSNEMKEEHIMLKQYERDAAIRGTTCTGAYNAKLMDTMKQVDPSGHSAHSSIYDCFAGDIEFMESFLGDVKNGAVELYETLNKPSSDASLILSSIPGIETGKDLQELVIPYDFAEGRWLTPREIPLTVMAAVSVGVGRKEMQIGLDGVFKGMRHLDSPSEVKQILNNMPELTGTNREKLLSVVQDGDLSKIVSELYRPGATIGDGGTATALINEFYSGTATHLKKANERLKGLNKIVLKGNLGLNDLDIAESLITDLENAIKLFD